MNTALSRSLIFFGIACVIGVGLFALDRMPAEMFLFDIRTDALSFFRAPIDQFYISVFFSWVEWLRRADFLALFLAALALGSLSQSAREFSQRRFSSSSAVAAAHVFLLLFLLPKASYSLPASPGIMIFFLVLFWLISVRPQATRPQSYA